MLLISGRKSLNFGHVWPDGHRYVFVLTNDVELEHVQVYVQAVADLEENLGFCSWSVSY